MQARTMLIGVGLAVALSAVASAKDVHGASGVIADLAGHDLAIGDPGSTKIYQHLVKSFPARGSSAVDHAASMCRIWNVGSEFLVFRVSRPCPSASYSSHFYWFDRASKPISQFVVSTGEHCVCDRCLLIPIPGTSSLAVEAFVTEIGSGSRELDAFGLVGRQPVLIRRAKLGSGLVQNDYSDALLSRSPRLVAYDQKFLRTALAGPNPTVQLEALTWLAGKHEKVSDSDRRLRPVLYADALRFEKLSGNPAIVRSVGELKLSKVRWVAQAALFVDRIRHIPK